MKSKISKFKIPAGFFMFFLLVSGVCVHAQNSAGTTANPDRNAMEEASIVKMGDKAPAFSVEMLDGSVFNLSEMEGKIVLLNFWATWCGPCMQEFKEIPDKILKRFEGNPDFVFIPVSREETRETVRKKMEQLKKAGIDFPVGLDPDKAVYSLYAEIYIPRNYLIDREGKVVFTSVGYEEKKFAELADTIEKLLKQGL
ncbi:MAG: TlpA family protein disulfide reductase [Tannerella sp.]|jgi:peroxiredoxin|nr:TlpA family protein disulfide reductase [Tannerella sp.]